MSRTFNTTVPPAASPLGKGHETASPWLPTASLPLVALVAFVSCATSSARSESAPPVAWQIVTGEVYDVATAGGMVLLLKEATLEAVRDGKVVWTINIGESQGWVIPLSTGCALVAPSASAELWCVGVTDGQIRWKVTPGAADPASPERAWIAAAARQGPEKAVLLMSDGRWATVDAAACQRADAACVTRSVDAPVPTVSPMDIVRVDGATLTKILSRSTAEWEGNGHWLQIAGFAYRFNPEKGEVTGLTHLATGKAILPEDTFTLVAPTYLLDPATGQDGYTMLTGWDKKEGADLKKLTLERLAKGEIGPTVEGRICNTTREGPCLAAQ